VAAAEVDVANLDAVPRAAAGAGAVAQSLTKTLQGGARNRIVAVALDAEATLTLLKLQLAPRHNAHIGRRGDGGGAGGKGRSRTCDKSAPTFSQYSAGHISTPL
jgi:hypothetical protein